MTGAYTLLKLLHQATALLSITGFMLRGYWMLSGSPLLRHRLTKVLPHVNDTIFLGSAIFLAVQIQQYPFAHGWLSAKVVGLLLYIGFGTYALKRGRTKRQRAVFFALALATFGYVVCVALSKSPLGPLALALSLDS